LRWRWPWRAERTSGAPLAAGSPFDASIDIGLGHLAPDARATAAAEVARVVGLIPGAGWISVEPHGPAGALAARVFPAGTSREPMAEPWLGLRLRVEEATRQVLDASRPPASRTGWAPGPAAPTRGFAEAMSPLQMDALQQLAFLAAASRLPAQPAPEPALEPAPPPVLATPVLATPEPEAASDVDRLAHLLGFVLPADARPTAAAAVRRFGSFAGVLAAPEAELRRVAGLGTHSIAAVKLVHAAAVRLARARVAAQPVLDDPKQLADYLAAALARERIEQFRILFLDDRGMLRADEVQASGTVNHTPVYPREVVRRALALGATSLVLVHNHPSGDPTASSDDIEMTRQVRAAARVMSIEVRDHVIIGNGRWLSFRESGLLD